MACKRHINKQQIDGYKYDLDHLIRFIKNSDCLIIEDQYSIDVCDIVMNFDSIIIRDKLIKFFNEHQY